MTYFTRAQSGENAGLLAPPVTPSGHRVSRGRVGAALLRPEWGRRRSDAHTAAAVPRSAGGVLPASPSRSAAVPEGLREPARESSSSPAAGGVALAWRRLTFRGRACCAWRQAAAAVGGRNFPVRVGQQPGRPTRSVLSAGRARDADGGPGRRGAHGLCLGECFFRFLKGSR